MEWDLVAYNAAMAACEKGSLWQQALELFQEINTQQLDSISLLVAVPVRWGHCCSRKFPIIINLFLQ